MAEIAEWLTAQGRARFIAGDDPPDAARQEINIIVREHRAALRLGGAAILTAAEVNAALDWKEAQMVEGWTPAEAALRDALLDEIAYVLPTQEDQRDVAAITLKVFEVLERLGWAKQEGPADG
jgi:hypothetical protein